MPFGKPGRLVSLIARALLQEEERVSRRNPTHHCQSAQRHSGDYTY